MAKTTKIKIVPAIHGNHVITVPVGSVPVGVLPLSTGQIGIQMLFSLDSSETTVTQYNISVFKCGLLANELEYFLNEQRRNKALVQMTSIDGQVFTVCAMLD